MEQDFGKRKIVLVKQIMADEGLLEANREHVRAYISFMEANGKDTKTIIKHLYSLRHFLKLMAPRVNLKKATRKDIEKALVGLNSTGLGTQTRNDIMKVIKAFYKHVLGEDLYYPPCVVWIKPKDVASRLLPEDILSEDEVARMISTATNVRDKALISLLYDSGIRMGELISMRKKDVDLSGKVAHITVNGKTGMRQIPIMLSAPVMAQYLEHMRDKKAADPLWWNLAQSHIKGPLDGAGVRKMLNVVAKAAKLEKHVYPHLLRHSRASNYANRLTEQQLKVFFGWTGSSDMAATYVHLSGRDIDSAVVAANGGKVEELKADSKLKTQTCPRCRFENPAQVSYCGRCAGPLDISIAMNSKDAESTLKESLFESLKDPKIIEEIVHEYLMQQRERGRKR